jgi:hypothetical protein
MPTDALDENTPSPEPLQRVASEWGLAALSIGGVLIVTAPVVLLLAVQLWEFGDRGSCTVHLHAWLARISVAVALATAMAGVCFGTRAVHYAATRNQPAGLAVAGLWLSVMALVLWVITSVALLNTTESLLLLYGR